MPNPDQESLLPRAGLLLQTISSLNGCGECERTRVAYSRWPLSISMTLNTGTFLQKHIKTHWKSFELCFSFVWKIVRIYSGNSLEESRSERIELISSWFNFIVPFFLMHILAWLQLVTKLKLLLFFSILYRRIEGIEGLKDHFFLNWAKKKSFKIELNEMRVLHQNLWKYLWKSLEFLQIK